MSAPKRPALDSMKNSIFIFITLSNPTNYISPESDCMDRE